MPPKMMVVNARCKKTGKSISFRVPEGTPMSQVMKEYVEHRKDPTRGKKQEKKRSWLDAATHSVSAVTNNVSAAADSVANKAHELMWVPPLPILLRRTPF